MLPVQMPELTCWYVLKHQVYSIDVSECDSDLCHLVSGEGEGDWLKVWDRATDGLSE